MEYNSLLNLVKNRRSIRQFKSDPVPDEYIEKIIEVARWAPSGLNTQPWEFFVVKKPELKKQIVNIISRYLKQIREMDNTREPWQSRKMTTSKSAEKGMGYGNAPVFIILFGDPRVNKGLPMGVRYDQDMRSMIYTSGLASAFLYMNMAATSLGLASQWTTLVRTPYAHCMIKDLLGIPHEFDIYDMMALGYPGFKPKPKFMRNQDKMVHYDECSPEEFRTDDEIKDFIIRTRNWNIGTHRRKPE